MMRPLNGAIAALTLIPAIALGSGRIALPIGIAIATFFIASYGYIVNDLCDFRADKINKPNRPFPSRKLSAWEGINAALLCIVLGAVALYGSKLSVWLFFAVFAAALFLYSFKLSSYLVIANLWVAILCSSACVLGGFLTNPDSQHRWLLIGGGALIFLYHFGREVIKDIEDVEGDRIAGRRTIPIVWGNKTARVFAATAFALLIVVSYLGYVLLHLSTAYLLLISLAVNVPLSLIFVLFVFRDGRDNMARASIALKVVMLPALGALTVAGVT